MTKIDIYSNKVIFYILFCLLVIIVLIFYQKIKYKIKYKNTISYFKSKKYTEKGKVLLIGDSIFQNEIYVPQNKSIPNLLKENISRRNMILITTAQDNSVINNVYSQLKTLKHIQNSRVDCIFLSIGGNNIINNYAPKTSMRKRKVKDISELISEYNNLVNKIIRIFPKSNLFLTTVYKPLHIYQKFHPIIEIWNNNIIELSKQKSENIKGVLRLDTIINNRGDLVYLIEPSVAGGKKIVRGIQQLINK